METFQGNLEQPPPSCLWEETSRGASVSTKTPLENRKGLNLFIGFLLAATEQKENKSVD